MGKNKALHSVVSSAAERGMEGNHCDREKEKDKIGIGLDDLKGPFQPEVFYGLITEA